MLEDVLSQIHLLLDMVDIVAKVVSTFAQLLAMSTLQDLVGLCLCTEQSTIEVNCLGSWPLSLLIVTPEE